jgi:hypothetical protein
LSVRVVKIEENWIDFDEIWYGECVPFEATPNSYFPISCSQYYQHDGWTCEVGDSIATLNVPQRPEIVYRNMFLKSEHIVLPGFSFFVTYTIK